MRIPSFVRYYQSEKNIEEPDVHALFITDLCAPLGHLRDLEYHVVLGMDSNNNARNRLSQLLLPTLESRKQSLIITAERVYLPLVPKTNNGNQLTIFGRPQDLRY